MTITRLDGGASSPIIAPLLAGRTANQTFTIPAAGISAGVRTIIHGYVVSRNPVSITDTKNNAWIFRTPLTEGVFLADCEVATALVAGDTITIALSGPDAIFVFCLTWWSRCQYRNHATGVWGINATAVTGGAVAVEIGDLVCGGFYGMATTITPIPSITTPGAGYTNNLGGSAQDFESNSVHMYDWESKLSAAAGSETATATLNTKVDFYRGGFTFAYLEPPPQPMMGVVTG